jgi:hypothetical protein
VKDVSRARKNVRPKIAILGLKIVSAQEAMIVSEEAPVIDTMIEIVEYHDRIMTRIMIRCDAMA